MPPKKTQTKKMFDELNDSISQPPAAEPSIASQNVLSEFMTVGRPLWDFHREHDPDEMEEMPKKALDKLQKEYDAQREPYFKKELKDFPDWKWVATRKGRKLYEKLDMEVQKRDQDLFGMHIYNDWTGYGIQEVLENHLQSFAKEFKKAKPSTMELCIHMEALAWLLCESDSGFQRWNMIDDGDRVCATIEIIGLALLSTLNQIERDGLWDVVPNISLVLAMFFVWTSNYEDAMSLSEQQWLTKLIVYADKHCMAIEGVYNIEEQLDKFDVDDLDDEEKEEIKKGPSKDKFKFMEHWKEFVAQYGKGGRTHTVGGKAFDITKMSKRERKQYSFDGTDPLDEMGMPPDIDSD